MKPPNVFTGYSNNQENKIHLPTPPFGDTATKVTRLDDSEFTKVQEGVELLILWGDSRIGASGVMIRFAPNTSQKIYYQDIRFAMIIPGEIKHREGN